MAAFYNQAILSYTGGSVSSNITAGEIVEPLTVTKTAVSAGYAPGGDVTYAIGLVNSSDADVTGVTVLTVTGRI